jgi:hypothetical protein
MIYLDNARYHHAKLVQAWLAQPGRRIKLHFVPALYGAFFVKLSILAPLSFFFFCCLRRPWTFVTIEGETRHRSAARSRDTALYPVASREAHHDALIRIVGRGSSEAVPF